MRKKIWIVLLIVLIVALAAIGIAWRINAQKKADTAVIPSASPLDTVQAQATAETIPTAEPTSEPDTETTEPAPAVSPASAPETGAPDYNDPDAWTYFALGEGKDADVFIICPTVDTKSESNAFDLNEKLKTRFIYALDLEKGIFSETGRLYSPYYRQMSINAYRFDESEREKAKAVAYRDVSAAFRWYLDHENGGRPLILAGFSQGGEMCLELLKEYYGDTAEGNALRSKLIAVYALGWAVTEQDVEDYPQIVPAQGELDPGTVISFDCEDGTLTETIIIPAGIKALSINPLNWKTDGTPADRSLNLGAVMDAGAEPIPALCGAYIGSRGELVVTDVRTEDYPPGLDIFPEGAYHLYDYMFFFTNLKQNVADRTAAFFAEVRQDS